MVCRSCPLELVQLPLSYQQWQWFGTHEHVIRSAKKCDLVSYPRSRHSRLRGNQLSPSKFKLVWWLRGAGMDVKRKRRWIPACAGMTAE